MVIYQKHSLLRSMSDVQRYDANISALNDQWENIKLLCEINCPVQSLSILPDMQKIQDSFYNLQQKLVETLVDETFSKTMQKMTSKAQVAVDILIRNLYERTADVGFLATDNDLRAFVCTGSSDDISRERIRMRLQDYVEKYSVYEEIIILDKECRVLANLDPQNAILDRVIDDPILLRTLAQKEGFIESFQPSALQANKKCSHIFSSCIAGDQRGEAAGILCLCFRFENEMERIFQTLSSDYDGSVLMIVDENNRVIASSDENHVPIDVCVEPVEQVEQAKNTIVYYRGVEYLSRTVPAHGYQDYSGLGWRGHCMLPLQLAFQEQPNLNEIVPDTMDALLQKADSFSPILKEIIEQTKEINLSLRRIVYNGQILSKENSVNDEFTHLKPILSAIGRMGGQTSDLFKKSVQNLFSTVVSTNLVDVRFLASLCVDIMDRNLYERANDCRWWALNSTFRTILSQDKISPIDIDKLTSILSYINRLYTVYTNLFLFDQTGTMIAVSNPRYSAKIGKKRNDSYIHSVLHNIHAERYYVSSFESTELYDNKHTYIYGASITDPYQTNRTIGGIGIVFDSDFQLRAMLEESIKSKKDTVALFVNRQRMILSSTALQYPTGAVLDLPERLFSIPTGSYTGEILVWEGNYYAVGCACSSSYREYKNTDAYQNDVLAVVMERLAVCDGQAVTDDSEDMALENTSIFSKEEARRKIVTFDVGGQRFAFDQHYVLEAIESNGFVRLPGTSGVVRGAVPYKDTYIAVINTHLQFFANQEHDLCPHLLVIRNAKGALIALEADDLGAVLEIGEKHIQPAPQLSGAENKFLGIIELATGKNKRFVLLTDPEQLFGGTEINLNFDMG